MSILAISTSSGQFALALGKKGEVQYNSNNHNNEKNLSVLLKSGLSVLNKKISDIERIIVNIGPGGTSSVRTGVAFANSLAYSLNIPVHPVSSLEIAGIDIQEKHKMPVISTVKSIKNNAFIGYYKKKNSFDLHYGKISEKIDQITKNDKEIAIVGYHREQIAEILNTKKIVDTGLHYGNIEVLIKYYQNFEKNHVLFPEIAHPITEQNLEIKRNK